MLKGWTKIALMFAIAFLVGCGQSTPATDQTGAASSAATDQMSAASSAATDQTAVSGSNTVLRVGATPVPHAEILRYVNDNLAAAQGVQIEIVEFTDYVQPNVALAEGQIDANFFQHVPYMEEFEQQRGVDLAPIANVHIEPLGIYSQQVESLDAVPDGAVVAIPNDATNGGRALQLLAANGLITLNEGVGTNATVRDIASNPKNLEITELEAAQLPRALEDAALSVINGNYALEADLQPSEDALALEQGQDNPYANVLAVTAERQNDPNLQKLAQLLNSPEVKQFIEQQYQGAVLPAF